MSKYTAQDRRDLAKKGHALPDGSFPISDDEDLLSAVRNWGLGNNPVAAKRHIIKRAREMNSLDVLPDKWLEKLQHEDIRTGDFLEHYGIKGMRWGVVREVDSSGRVAGPASDKAAVRQEKRDNRAQKFETKAQGYQKQIDDINARAASGAFTASNYRNELTHLRDQALADAEAKRQGKLSSTQKKVIVGAAVAGTIIAAVVIKGNLESGEARRLMNKGQAFIQRAEGFKFKKNLEFARKDLNADEVMDKVVKGVNPDYGGIGTKNNCRRATFAYEMRRRGYDVSATKTINGSGQNGAGLLNAVTPSEKIMSTGTLGYTARLAKEQIGREAGKTDQTPLADIVTRFGAGAREKIPEPSINGIFSTLAKEPNGSRGELVVKWKMGGGHSMAYEIFDGKPVIIDAQTGTKIADPLAAVKHGLHQVDSAGYTRLDSRPLNEDYLQRWVKNAK